MIPQTFPRFGRSLAPWRETHFRGSLVAAREAETHRKGAKDAKGDSHASNSKRVIDSKSVPHRSGELSLTDGGFVFRSRQSRIVQDS